MRGVIAYGTVCFRFAKQRNKRNGRPFAKGFVKQRNNENEDLASPAVVHEHYAAFAKQRNNENEYLNSPAVFSVHCAAPKKRNLTRIHYIFILN
jgi:hypothetical protein